MSLRRLFWLVAISTVASAFPVLAARAAGPLEVSLARTPFPQRALVLALPQRMHVTARDVHVLENGRPVTRLSVVPETHASTGSFGFVLALDASNSMSGGPAAAAEAAARAFAAERAPSATLGLVSFNARIDVLLGPTADAAAIDSALARRPRLAEGTRMRDAVATSLALLSRARVRAGAVVVLSDGADIGSRTSVAQLVRLARAAGIRVFTVGLRSPQFRAAALQTLATRTGGRYVEAVSTKSLEPLFRSLSRELAASYLVRYHSDATPGTRVHVTVAVAGVAPTATAVYDAPASGAPAAVEPAQDRFWRSEGALAAIAGLAALLAGLAVLLLARSLRPSAVSRIGAYVRLDQRETGRHDGFGDTVEHVLERSFRRVRGWDRFAEEVEMARLPSSPASLAAWTAAAALLAGPGAAALTMQPLLLLLAAGPPLAGRLLLTRRLRRLRLRFEDDLPDNIEVLASALRAGHGLSSALGVVAGDSTEPSRSEFERALADERLGVPLEDALSNIARRMASSDVEQVALVAALHRETGGNTAEVLDRVHDALRERAELRRMVRALTAEGRMTRWILTAMPVALIVAITLLNKSYLAPLLYTNGGRALLALAAVMVVAGSLVIKRIVEIEI